MEGLLTEAEILEKLGSRNFKTILTLSFIKQKLYQNHQPLVLDLKWRKDVLPKVGLSRDVLTKTIKKLTQLDILRETTKDEYLLNPLVCYKGNISKSFVKTAAYYFSTEPAKGIDEWLENKFVTEFDQDLQLIESYKKAMAGLLLEDLTE